MKTKSGFLLNLAVAFSLVLAVWPARSLAEPAATESGASEEAGPVLGPSPAPIALRIPSGIALHIPSGIALRIPSGIVQQPGPVDVREPQSNDVSSADEAVLSKLSPELRELAKSRSEVPAFVTVLMQTGTRWQPYLENGVPRKPLGEFQWVSGEADGIALLKLASLPGVISVYSPESRVPTPFPGEEELRRRPRPLSPEELAEAKKSMARLAEGMTPDEVRARLASDPEFRGQFEELLNISLADLVETPRAAPDATQGNIVRPSTIKVKDVHNAPQAWAKGFTGEGVVAAVVDTGVDFGHPDLMGTWAVVTGTSPYAGWPFAYHTLSGYFAAQGIYQSTLDPYSFNALWHVETEPVPDPTFWGGGTVVLPSEGVTVTAVLTVDQFFGSAFTYVFSNTSQSGNYRYAIHPDVYLWFAAWFFGGAGFADPNAVLLVDENVAGEYDTIYVDLDMDLDFRDEVPLTMANPSTNKDIDGDGVGDLSAGLLTWISDGLNPPPGTGVLFEDAPVPGEAELLVFVGDLDSHGTNVAGDIAAQGVITDPFELGPINPVFHTVVTDTTVITQNVLSGMAPGARIAAFQEGFLFEMDSWALNALGFDGVPQTGDEVQISNNSWGVIINTADGWESVSRFAHYLNRNYAPNLAFIIASGNDGHGYGTVGTPGEGTLIEVGASTQYGTLIDSPFGSGFEPITDTEMLTWGDVQPWSNRGPGLVGGLQPSVVAVGAWGTGANPLNITGLTNGIPSGNFAYNLFGGTSMAAPIASGNLALIYQAFESEHGRRPTYSEARMLLMNGANDLNYDVLVQGAGNVDADRSTDIAAGLGGVMVSPPLWQAGGYQGLEFPIFPNIMYPGESDTQTFTVTNQATGSAAVALTDAVFRRFDEISFTVTITDAAVPAFQTPTWITDVTQIISDAAPDLVRAHVIFPYEQFDVGEDYFSESGWRVLFYDWKDLNGDGDLWEDTNGDGVVDDGEIDQTPWEYNRFAYGYPKANYLEISLGNPTERMHDGVFFALQRRYREADWPAGMATTFEVRFIFYEKQDWDWLTTAPTSFNVGGGGSGTFEATLNVPANADPGLYQAAIYAAAGGNTTVIPVLVNVAAGSPTFSFGASSLSEPLGDHPYDNGHMYGGYDWFGYQTNGDHRLYFFDIPEGTLGPDSAQHMIVDTTWVYTPTDIDTRVFAAALDDFSTNDPAFFGPQGIEQVASSINTASGFQDTFYTFQTATGGPREIIGAEIREGLGFVELQEVLYAGEVVAEPFVGQSYRVEIAPAPVEITTDQPTGSQQMTFMSDAAIAEGITVTAVGLYQPMSLTDEFIAATNASSFYQVTLHDAVMLEITTTSANMDLDVDLYVYRDSDGDGTYDEFVGASETSASEEWVRIDFPLDGDYRIEVYGFSVPVGGARYDIHITPAQGEEMTVTGLPSGAIDADTPVTFTVSFEHRPPAGDWEGLVFIGPANAPTALRVPFLVHFEGAIALDVSKDASASRLETGEVLTYTIVARNTGSFSETVRLEDPLPGLLTYQAGSGTATEGTVDFDFIREILTWEGALEGGQAVTVTFGAVARSGSGEAFNQVTLRGLQSGQVVTATANTQINPGEIVLYMPIIAKNYSP